AGRVVGVGRRPEVAAAGGRAVVPELVLGRGIAVGVGVGEPVGDLRPLVGVQAVVVDRRHRRVICRQGRRRQRRVVAVALAVGGVDEQRLAAGGGAGGVGEGGTV